MGLISNTFNSYNKWTASKFTDLFNMKFVNETKTDGLMWHLQEIRQKTYDAILALEDGITANDSKISNNLGRIEANSNSLQSHGTRLNNVEAGVTANDSKITNNLNKIENLYKEFGQNSSANRELIVDSGWVEGTVVVQKLGAGGVQNTISVCYGYENYTTYSDGRGIRIEVTQTGINVNQQDLVLTHAKLRYPV